MSATAALTAPTTRHAPRQLPRPSHRQAAAPQAAGTVRAPPLPGEQSPAGPGSPPPLGRPCAELVEPAPTPPPPREPGTARGRGLPGSPFDERCPRPWRSRWRCARDGVVRSICAHARRPGLRSARNGPRGAAWDEGTDRKASSRRPPPPQTPPHGGRSTPPTPRRDAWQATPRPDAGLPHLERSRPQPVHHGAEGLRSGKYLIALNRATARKGGENG